MKSTKHICIFITMICFMLSGCGDKFTSLKVTPTLENIHNLKLTHEEYPKVNGSTPTSTISGLVYEALTDKKYNANNEKINHEGTSSSYESLIAGRCDIIISQQASPEIENKLKEVALIEPVAKDGLVMITTKDNKIESLTLSQLRNIFTGKYKNWQKVGGYNQRIVTIQRNETGGSQILIDKYIMKGEPMLKVPEFLKPASMSEMSTAVGKYTNLGHTIGYSTYYYVSTYDVRKNLKMIKINNVMPTVETISDDSYPITSKIFVAIRKDEPNDSPARKMFNWLLSSGGQKVVAKSGYTSILK